MPVNNIKDKMKKAAENAEHSKNGKKKKVEKYDAEEFYTRQVYNIPGDLMNALEKRRIKLSSYAVQSMLKQAKEDGLL